MISTVFFVAAEGGERGCANAVSWALTRRGNDGEEVFVVRCVWIWARGARGSL